MNTKSIAINILLVIVSIGFVLLLLETALSFGVIDQEEPDTAFDEGLFRAFSYHQEYGWTFAPNSQVNLSLGDQPCARYTHNNKGFRENYDKGDEDSIIALGDSFTHGILASDNATYPHLLDRWTPNSSVKNYGIGAYGTDNSLLVYRDVGEDIEHSVVVLGYYLGNDMFYNSHNHPYRPQFEIKEDKLKLVHSPKNIDPDSYETGEFTGISGWLREHTETYPYLKPRFTNVLERMGITTQEYEPDGYSRDPPNRTELQDKKRLTVAILHELRREATQNGADLVILSIPERSEVRPDRPFRFPKSEAQWYWEYQRDMLRNISNSSPTVTYEPIKSELRKEVQNGMQVYGRNDPHLTERGYRVTAVELYTHLTEEGYIEETDPNFSKDYSTNITECVNSMSEVSFDK